jgi:hypothetical protein
MKEWLTWCLNRLRCMTPVEILHRAVRMLSTHAECAGLLASEVVPPPDLVPASRPWMHVAARVDVARYLAAADRIAAGQSALPATVSARNRSSQQIMG